LVDGHPSSSLRRSWRRYVKKPCYLSIRAGLYADENSKGLYDTGKN
jgi:metallophosphoesterase superfamily enzyme